MKISYFLVISFISICLHEGLATDSTQIRRRSINVATETRIDSIITYLRRKMGSSYDTHAISMPDGRSMAGLNQSVSSFLSALCPLTRHRIKNHYELFQDDNTIDDDQKEYYSIYYNLTQSIDPKAPLSGVDTPLQFPIVQSGVPLGTNTTSDVTQGHTTLSNIAGFVMAAGFVLGAIATVFILTKRRQAKKKVMPVRNLVAL